MDLFSLPFFMDYSNGRLLRLIECIESIKSDVKKKMMLACACDPHTKVTGRSLAKKFLRRHRGSSGKPPASFRRSSSPQRRSLHRQYFCITPHRGPV